MTLRRGSNAIDAGAVIPNINEDYQGSAPDLGAHEFGKPLPQYGPRPINTPSPEPPKNPPTEPPKNLRLISQKCTADGYLTQNSRRKTSKSSPQHMPNGSRCRLF
jgi:hypothetical protein